MCLHRRRLWLNSCFKQSLTPKETKRVQRNLANTFPLGGSPYRYEQESYLKLFQCPSGSSAIGLHCFWETKCSSCDTLGSPNPMTSPNYLSGVTQSHDITYLLSIWQTFGVLVPYPMRLIYPFSGPPRVLRGVIYKWWHSTSGRDQHDSYFQMHKT